MMQSLALITMTWMLQFVSGYHVTSLIVTEDDEEEEEMDLDAIAREGFGEEEDDDDGEYDGDVFADAEEFEHLLDEGNEQVSPILVPDSRLSGGDIEAASQLGGQIIEEAKRSKDGRGASDQTCW